MQEQELKPAFGRAALFAAVLILLAFTPLWSMYVPGRIGTLMFLWSQFIVPVNTYSRGSTQVWPWTWLIIWIISTALFAVVTRRLRLRTTLLAALCAILVITVLIHVATSALGWTFELDGP
jgi:hypothetical protein